MKTAILGGTGFIGTNLALELQRNYRNQEVFLFDSHLVNPQNKIAQVDFPFIKGDMTKYAELRSFIRKIKPDRIFHFAANSDIKASQVDSLIDLKNTFLTTEILGQVLVEFPINELIFASSSAVYGPKSNSIKEDESCNPISSYGWMKLTSEHLLVQLEERNIVGKLLIARFPNVTGKWQTHGVVFDLVKKLRLNPNRLEILGNGEQSKPYLSAHELVKIICNIIDTQMLTNNIVNIAPKSNFKVAEIVELLLKKSELCPELIFGDTEYGWVGDVPKYELNTEKLYSQLPKLKMSSSEESIELAIDWMWENSEKFK